MTHRPNPATLCLTQEHRINARSGWWHTVHNPLIPGDYVQVWLTPPYSPVLPTWDEVRHLRLGVSERQRHLSEPRSLFAANSQLRHPQGLGPCHVEVKDAVGTVQNGISRKTGKPYAMAEQRVAMFVPGADYPVVGPRDIFVPRNPDGSFREPEWMAPGRYEVPVKLINGDFGRVTSVIDWRSVKPLQQGNAQPIKAAA